MTGVYLLLIVFIVLGSMLGLIAFFAYRRVMRRAKGIERGLKMVPLLIHLPPPGDDEQSNRDPRELMQQRISESQMLYDLIAGTAKQGFASSFYGQRHIAFEIIASNGLIHYFVAVPVALVSTVEQAVLTTYPGSRIEEVEDHNIFSPQGKLTGTVGGELTLRHQFSYPIGTYQQMERDPMEALINTLSKLQLGDGAAVQIMLRPAKPGWIKASEKLVAKKRHQKHATGLSLTPKDIAMAAVKAPDQQHKEQQQYELSKLEESMMQAVEEKVRHPGFEILVRVLVSSPSYDRSQSLLRGITTTFALFEAPGSNGFQFLEARDVQGLVTAFIFRFFPPEVSSSILSSPELATLFHLPDSQFTGTSQVERQHSKQVESPPNMPTRGLLMGYNFYRGTKKEVHLDLEDRRRHVYVVGQTGTGKTTFLENMMVQDMLAGNGFAFIDPHGDAAEKLISMVPKERAEDVVYFNPSDTEHPLGINLFEFDSPDQKDFIVNEAINLLYKLYDPGRTGIMGPRFEHWFRNAALTLMADPDGATFIELPKVFTDTTYLKNKFKYLKDPTVMEFWTKEMGQTSDYHKSEMLGWFVSKFGAFQTNDMMRNIIGQTSSAFDIREIMDKRKILIVNLSKGQVGELNSKLLGMIFVMKIQQAAMSRADMPENERVDFSLYVDEFQNFSTDSFASILSEARKYRLNLIVANQFIGQLSDEIREAVFGNVGTKLAYRTGPEDAEFLVKQFEPAFDTHDLINLPNFNSVIRLMVGGLPTQPFSLTALPPLGEPHQEMLMAVKQLSAAKYGVPRPTVEADVYARLQNQPRPKMAAPQVQPVPAPAPAVAQSVPQPAPSPVVPSVPAPAPIQQAAQPVTQSPQVAVAAPMPAPQPAPLPPEPVSTPPQAPAAPPPAPQPVPVSAPTIPQLGDSRPAVAPVTPASQPVPEPSSIPAPPQELPPTPIPTQATSQPAAAPTQSTANPDYQAQKSSSGNEASIADVVGAEAAKPKPVTEPIETLLIEAHETDGKTDTLTPAAPPLLIEAEEKDGIVDAPAPQPAPVPPPPPKPVPIPQPAPVQPIAPNPNSVFHPAPVHMPKPEPKPAPQPKPQPQPQKHSKSQASQRHSQDSKPRTEHQKPAKTMIATHMSHRLPASDEVQHSDSDRIRKHHSKQPQPGNAQPKKKSRQHSGESPRYKDAAKPAAAKHPGSNPQAQEPVETPRIVVPPVSVPAPAQVPVSPPPQAEEVPSPTEKLAESVNERLEDLVHPHPQQPAPVIQPAPEPKSAPDIKPEPKLESMSVPEPKVEAKPQPKPVPVQPAPQPQPEPAAATPPTPQPGEIMVDENGNVVQG